MQEACKIHERKSRNRCDLGTQLLLKTRNMKDRMEKTIRRKSQLVSNRTKLLQNLRRTKKSRRKLVELEPLGPQGKLHIGLDSQINHSKLKLIPSNVLPVILYNYTSYTIFMNIPKINLIFSESIFTHEGWYYCVILSKSKFATVHSINQVLLLHTLQFILL